MDLLIGRKKRINVDFRLLHRILYALLRMRELGLRVYRILAYDGSYLQPFFLGFLPAKLRRQLYLAFFQYFFCYRENVVRSENFKVTFGGFRSLRCIGEYMVHSEHARERNRLAFLV